MSDTTFLLAISLVLATILIVFAMRYISRLAEARAHIASESGYRDLAERSVSVQAQQAKSLQYIEGELTQIGMRLKDVAKILKEVE